MGRAAKSYRMVKNNLFFKRVSRVAGISTPTLETNVRKLLEARKLLRYGGGPVE